MFDPRSDDEMVVDEQAAAVEHLKVGDVITFVAYAPDQTDTSGPALGAKVGLHITGIVRDVDEFLFTPGALVSPGVIAHYHSDMFLADNAMVRLRRGEADMAALRRDANALVAPGVPVLDLHSASRRVTTTLAVEPSSPSLAWTNSKGQPSGADEVGDIGRCEPGTSDGPGSTEPATLSSQGAPSSTPIAGDFDVRPAAWAP
jgi:hypothetical protein